MCKKLKCGKMRLKKALFINRAPFDKLELDFDDSNVFLLFDINGKGKTTILLYIVDAFYELAKKGYRNEFENKGIFIMNINMQSNVMYVKMYGII